MEAGRFSAGFLVLGCLTEGGWEVQLGEGFLWGLLHSSLAVTPGVFLLAGGGYKNQKEPRRSVGGESRGKWRGSQLSHWDLPLRGAPVSSGSP